MRRVSIGDFFSIDGKLYIFNKTSVLLFNLATKVREDGIIEEGFICMERYFPSKIVKRRCIRYFTLDELFNIVNSENFTQGRRNT